MDLINARVILPRRKTGIYGDLPLRQKTAKSLQDISTEGSLMFYTSNGQTYIQTNMKVDDSGKEIFTISNLKTTKFR